MENNLIIFQIEDILNIPLKTPQCGIQDFPVLLTFSLKDNKNVMFPDKGSSHTGPSLSCPK
jgi:hypothetical protein